MIKTKALFLLCVCLISFKVRGALTCYNYETHVSETCQVAYVLGDLQDFTAALTQEESETITSLFGRENIREFSVSNYKGFHEVLDFVESEGIHVLIFSGHGSFNGELALSGNRWGMSDKESEKYHFIPSVDLLKRPKDTNLNAIFLVSCLGAFQNYFWGNYAPKAKVVASPFSIPFSTFRVLFSKQVAEKILKTKGPGLVELSSLEHYEILRLKNGKLPTNKMGEFLFTFYPYEQGDLIKDDGSHPLNHSSDFDYGFSNFKSAVSSVVREIGKQPQKEKTVQTLYTAINKKLIKLNLKPVNATGKPLVFYEGIRKKYGHLESQCTPVLSEYYKKRFRDEESDFKTTTPYSECESEYNGKTYGHCDFHEGPSTCVHGSFYTFNHDSVNGKKVQKTRTNTWVNNLGKKVIEACCPIQYKKQGNFFNKVLIEQESL